MIICNLKKFQDQEYQLKKDVNRIEKEFNILEKNYTLEIEAIRQKQIKISYESSSSQSNPNLSNDNFSISSGTETLKKESSNTNYQISEEIMRIQEQKLSEVTKECRKVIQAARIEIQAKEQEVRSLREQIYKIPQIESELARWMSSSALISSLFVGVYSKWAVFLNLKCTLNELSEAIVDKVELSENSPSFKFFEVRKCFWAIRFMNRLRKSSRNTKTMENQIQSIEDVSLITGINSKGTNMFARLMILSSKKKSLATILINQIRTQNNCEIALKQYFGLKTVNVYPSSIFNFVRIVNGSESEFSKIEENRIKELEAEVEEYIEKTGILDKKVKDASTLISQAHSALIEKDRAINRLMTHKSESLN